MKVRISRKSNLEEISNHQETKKMHRRLRGRSSSRPRVARDPRETELLPSMARVNREIKDMSKELLGRREMQPPELAEWIKDKRGERLRLEQQGIHVATVAGKLCCIYMKHDIEKGSPQWHPYKYQVSGPGTSVKVKRNL